MVEINNQTKNKIDVELIARVASKFLEKHKKSKYGLSIAFIGDKAMTVLNTAYRGKKKPTDVLSFEGEGKFLGEIVIDYSQIKRQAKAAGKTIKDELIFILVHGLLHLIGYDDEFEEDRLGMMKLGEDFIKKSKF